VSPCVRDQWPTPLCRIARWSAGRVTGDRRPGGAAQAPATLAPPWLIGSWPISSTGSGEVRAWNSDRLGQLTRAFRLGQGVDQFGRCGPVDLPSRLRGRARRASRPCARALPRCPRPTTPLVASRCATPICVAGWGQSRRRRWSSPRPRTWPRRPRPRWPWPWRCRGGAGLTIAGAGHFAVLEAPEAFNAGHDTRFSPRRPRHEPTLHHHRRDHRLGGAEIR